ncbi:glycosyltransferase family 2 protein [Fodinibacter luteus]|uniref:glycosyltransferase family 2 protein n=1 Tax=Fodinibacter luteus TaxID=552064 RepID=UPI0031E7B00F
MTAIVPAYNSEKFIAQALGCLASQTWNDLEILVGDDASTDGTLDVIRRFADGRSNVVVVAREVNVGWLANSNDLLSRASGELLFFAFHDDLVHPEYVERLVHALSQNHRAVLAFSDLDLVALDGERSSCTFPDLDGIHGRLARGIGMAKRPTNWWVAIHGLVRTSAARQVGGLRLNEAGEYAADWPWMMHLALLGEFVRVPESLCIKTVREGSVSRSWGSGGELGRAARKACVAEVWRSPLSWAEKLLLTAEIRRSVPLPAHMRPAARRTLRRLLP